MSLQALSPANAQPIARPDTVFGQQPNDVTPAVRGTTHNISDAVATAQFDSDRPVEEQEGPPAVIVSLTNDGTESDESDEKQAEDDEFTPYQPEVTGARLAGDLTEDEQKMVEELKKRDLEVRTHEMQHQAVGGQYAGAASYTFQTGPDGRQYAIGGEVSISVGEVAGNPEKTIEKMRVVRAAALAPAEPSAQDRAVAAQASQMMMKAQSELLKAQQEGGEAEEVQRFSTTA